MNQSDSFALTFVSEVEERSVALYWTTERAAKLIVSKLRLRIGLWIEEVARVELVVRKNSNREPWKSFVPDLVTIFTIAPELRPYSASKFERIAASEIASIGRIVAEFRKHRLR